MSKKTNKKIAAAAVVATMVTQNIQPLFALEEVNTELPMAKDLIISEYVEGSSNNKAIEIYNGTGETVNLSDYSVELYLNGSKEAGKSEILSGELKHDETYVIVNSQAGDILKSKADKLSTSVTSYNGDDAIVLKHNDEVIDSVGKVGEDPGTAWENNGASTLDMTLIRKPSISEGDKNISDEFDPSSEWIACSKDTFENLGSHVMDVVHGADTVLPTGEVIEQIKSHNISDDLEIRVNASDDRRIDSVVLYYRNTGETEYKEMLLSKDNGVYVGIIEKAKLSTDGFEYYIGISDGTNTVNLPADKSNPYTITITDMDIEGPTISRVYPSHNYNTGSEAKPLIGADFKDRTGINTDSIKLTLDGVDITSKSTIAEDSIRYTPETDLSEGTHNLKLELEDSSDKKNKTTKEWSFYVGEEEINTYFGQIHSHTNLSDGLGDIDEAYDYARNKAKVDFLAVTDHSNWFDNESLANINDGSASEEWKLAQATANEKNDDGNFVAMYGYEMSWSASTGGYGHMNTYNTPGFETRTNSSMTLKKYYETLKTQPQSISMFNHPGETFGDFEGFAHYDEAIDELITLIEVGNSDGDINSNNYFPSYDKYIEALDKGWHIAPTNGQDNHKGKWGDANTTRTVVQTSELTRENVYQAMRDRNVYSTEDENLEVIYKINGNTMGSILDEVENLDFDITINEPDASDKISKVEIIVNGGKTIKEFNSVENNQRLQFTLPSTYSYYIVQITQADGQKTITAPIWVGEMTKVGISSMESDKALALVGENINLSTKLYNNENVSATDVKIEYYLGNENNKIGETVVGTMEGTTEHISNFTYTPSKAGSYNIIAKASMTVNGVELTSTEKVSFVVKDESQVSKILIDGSKQNDYVNGKYFDKISTFSDIALENGAKATVNKDEITDEVLEDVSLLVISDPQSTTDKSNAELASQKYSESELAAIKKFVDNGGNLVITSKADYGDGVDEYQNSEQGNAVLEAIGASLRFNDDQLIDNEKYSNQNYRLYFDRYNTNSSLLQGVDTTQTYSFYSGCSIIADESNENVDIIVKGHTSTLSSDADKKGDATPIKEGEAVALAMETLESGAKVIVGGTTFFSDFELDKNEYSNDDIVKNIVKQLSPKPQLPITSIAEVRKDEDNDNRADNFGLPFAIEGTVTVASSAASSTNAFFDCMYVQDETGGITVFGISETPVKVGQKVRVEGIVDEYLGDTELMLTNEFTDVTIIDESINPIDPIKLSTADSMLESNEGLLVKVEGTVTKMEGQNIYVNDGSGVARAYVEGYIGSSSGADRDYTKRIAVGDKVSIVGLASEDGEDFTKRLRVRDTDEIVKLDSTQPEDGGTNNGGTNNGGSNNEGTNNGGSNNGGTNNGGSNNGGTNNDGSNNGGTNNDGSNNESPKTGDVAMGGLFTSAIASIAGLGFLNRRKRK
ncbi:MAG: CehA/McbA family metallohydrolase [Peptostreptococcaceae bacterium]|nr:CehA/McbA family metallohydrolase [Peptostreptococcaceae bacterium]